MRTKKQIKARMRTIKVRMSNSTLISDSWFKDADKVEREIAKLSQKHESLMRRGMTECDRWDVLRKQLHDLEYDLSHSNE